MFKRIWAVALRDLRSGLRDYMILYILLAPFILALVLKAFIPTAGANLIHVAVLESDNPAWIATLEQYGTVEQLPDRDSLLNRIRQTDDVIGLVQQGDQTEVITAGNEVEGTADLVRSVINGLALDEQTMPVTLSFADLGWQLSPLLQHGSAFILIFISIFGGMVIMLGLVEEKQYNTLAAINVSAITRSEYVMGKGVVGFLMPIVHAYAILFILELTDINFAMVSLVILSIALIGVIIGFVIGVNNDNQMTAVSSMKMIFLPIFGSLFGAIFLPERWLPVLYWSPFYWAFDAVTAIILKEATWLQILRNCGVILFISVLVFLLLQKKIKRGMA